MPERKVSRGRPRRQPSRAQPKPCTAPTVNAATESEVPGLEAETLFLPSQIEHLVVSGLTPNPRNARTHTKQQVHHISASIRTFGFTNPVLIDAEGTIIAGHGRVEAAKLVGMSQVPCIRIEHLTDDQKRAYVIADNRLAELAGWDDEILAIELQHLSEVEIDFDVEVTGFETAEIDYRIESLAADEPDEADDLSDLEADLPTVSQLGDLWQMGPHRLLCGDALTGGCYVQLVGGAMMRMVFADPPYNVPIDGHVCGRGRIKHRDFAMASGEMSEAEFTAFLTAVLGNLAATCTNGGLIYVAMDWRHLFELLSAGQAANLTQLNLCVWAKDNGGLGSFYRSQHELVAVFKVGDGPHINTIQLGRHGRYRTNVWHYPGVNSLRRGRMCDLAMHPTVKPVALVADAIKDCTRRGDLVLDAFLGSGTTLIAAEKTGRVAYGMELDPGYVDVAVRRWQRLTGDAAVHAETGQSFDELAIARAADEDTADGPQTAREVSDD